MATKRGYYKEELNRAVDNLEMALTHLARLVEAYGPYHPEIAEQVRLIGNAIVEIATAIKTVQESI